MGYYWAPKSSGACFMGGGRKMRYKIMHSEAFLGGWMGFNRITNSGPYLLLNIDLEP